jgi:hypothetical protein
MGNLLLELSRLGLEFCLDFQDRLYVPGPMQHSDDFDTVIRCAVEDEELLKPTNGPGAELGHLRVTELAKPAHTGHSRELPEGVLGCVIEPAAYRDTVLRDEVGDLIDIASSPWPNFDSRPPPHGSSGSGWRSSYRRRISSQSASDISLAGPLSKPSSSMDSRLSSACRLSSWRSSASIHSLIVP